MSESPFQLTLEVRDYECDLQGIVNNSVYQHYLEHARHKFLAANGVDFADLAAKGVNLVVIKAELEYKQPLKPGETFTVSVRLEKEGRIRFAFVQEVRRQSDDKLMVKGRITGTSLNERGRPCQLDELDALFA